MRNTLPLIHEACFGTSADIQRHGQSRPLIMGHSGLFMNGRECGNLRAIHVPRPKIRIQDPQDPTTKWDAKIQDLQDPTAKPLDQDI